METAFSLFLTTLFNPVLLVLLLILFFAGKLLGKLSVRMNIWKFLLLAYFAVFLIEPLRNAGWFIGGVFLLGFFSNHVARLPGILMWADGLGDIYYAYKYRSAYDDIRQREKETQQRVKEERKRTAQNNTGNASAQNAWREDAKRHRRQGSTHDNEYAHERTGYGYTSENARARIGSQPNSNRSSAGSSIRDTHLEALGLAPGRAYTLREIKIAYRRRVMATHPDAGGSSIEFRQVINAWEWLRSTV